MFVYIGGGFRLGTFYPTVLSGDSVRGGYCPGNYVRGDFVQGDFVFDCF